MLGFNGASKPWVNGESLSQSNHRTIGRSVPTGYDMDHRGSDIGLWPLKMSLCLLVTNAGRVTWKELLSITHNTLVIKKLFYFFTITQLLKKHIQIHLAIPLGAVWKHWTNGRALRVDSLPWNQTNNWTYLCYASSIQLFRTRTYVQHLFNGVVWHFKE